MLTRLPSCSRACGTMLRRIMPSTAWEGDAKLRMRARQHGPGYLCTDVNAKLALKHRRVSVIPCPAQECAEGVCTCPHSVR